MNSNINDLNPDRPRRGRRHHGHGGPRRGDGPHGGGRGGGRGRGRRAQRGDVRAAILTLLAEEPMHGYQLMQTIAERSGGRWSPSPGAVYPTLSALSDEGLLTLSEAEGRKLATLTPAGREHVATNADVWPDPFHAARGDDATGPDLGSLTRELADAIRHAARTASDPQRERLAEILATARRDVYRALADATDA